MSMTFLVTGGAGFIGSNIVEKLLELGNKVRVLDNFSTGKRENLALFDKDIEIIEGDIRSYHIVREAVDNVDYILHQAALPSVPRSIKDPITSNEVNVNGILNILNAAKDSKVKRIVYASSSSIYGRNSELPKDERMLPQPISPYAVSKLAGEKYCQVFSEIYGLETICLRYFNVFGPRQNPFSQYSAVIPKFILAILKDESPIIYGDGTQSRDFTFVSNVVDANILACFNGVGKGEVINIACGKKHNLLFLINEINRILGKNVKPLFREKKLGDIDHSLANIEKAEKLINYFPLIDFKEGLKITVRKFQDINEIHPFLTEHHVRVAIS